MVRWNVLLLACKEFFRRRIGLFLIELFLLLVDAPVMTEWIDDLSAIMLSPSSVSNTSL